MSIYNFRYFIYRVLRKFAYTTNRNLSEEKFDKIYIKILNKFKKNYSMCLFGNTFHYEFNNDIGFTLYMHGEFEKNEISFCEKFITKNSIVLDIGANIGLHTVFFSKWAYDGMVFSFEPSHSTFNSLIKNVSNDQNVYPLNLGLSNHNSILKFYESSDNAYSSLKDTKRKSVVKITNIISYRLDDLFLKLNLEKIDFVKIDVEGFENEVILGMEQMIKKYQPIIYCEIYKGVDSNLEPNITINYLINCGYDAFVVKGNELRKFVKHEDEFHNYFFVPSLNVSLYSFLNKHKNLSTNVIF